MSSSYCSLYLKLPLVKNRCWCLVILIWVLQTLLPLFIFFWIFRLMRVWIIVSASVVFIIWSSMRYVQVLVPDSVLWGLSNRFWVSDILTPTFLDVLRFQEVPLVEPSIQASDSTPGCDPTKFGVTFFFSLCVSSWKEYIKIKCKFSQKKRYIIFIILCVF